MLTFFDEEAFRVGAEDFRGIDAEKCGRLMMSDTELFSFRGKPSGSTFGHFSSIDSTHRQPTNNLSKDFWISLVFEHAQRMF